MQIRELLARGRPTFSFEFFPPKSEEAAKQLEQTIAELRELHPSFVSVTYGAGGSTRERTIEIVTRVKRETGIEARSRRKEGPALPPLNSRMDGITLG